MTENEKADEVAREGSLAERDCGDGEWGEERAGPLAGLGSRENSTVLRPARAHR